MFQTIVNDVVTYGPIVVTAAAAAAATLPQGAPGSAWSYARKIIDLLAANWGNAKNAKKS